MTMFQIKAPFPDRQIPQTSDVCKPENVTGPAPSMPRSQSSPSPLQAIARLSGERTGVQTALPRPSSRDGNLAALAASFSDGLAPAHPAEFAAIRLPGARDAVDALAAQFGAATVASRLAHDVFRDAEALKKQLAHESKTEITPEEYARIEPFGACAKLAPAGAEKHGYLPDLRHAGAEATAGVVEARHDATGKLVDLHASGCLGVPDGWHVQDRLSMDAGGMAKLRTTLSGPQGESGMIVRSFDGRTLYLDKAYKSTLPTRLSGVPGFDRPLATINYLTARACRVLGVTPDNLQQIKVNRLQHRAALAHVDWLLRRHPQKSMGELIDHTTWARSYIRETAANLGHITQPRPAIDLEGGPNWIRSHPGAQRREWNYLTMETERLTIKHLTGQKLPRVDDRSIGWQDAAIQAVATFKGKRCAGLDPIEALSVAADIDQLLVRRLDAIRHEEKALRKRYDLPDDSVPRHFNFDVTFQSVKRNPAVPPQADAGDR